MTLFWEASRPRLAPRMTQAITKPSLGFSHRSPMFPAGQPSGAAPPACTAWLSGSHSRKLDGLINAIADGLKTPGLKSKLEELEGRKGELEAQVEAALPPLPRLHPNLAELYRQKVANLQEALSAPDTQTEALEVLRGLIERVVVQPQEKGFEVGLIGEIAAMVDLGAHNKKADPKGSAVPAAYRSSVRVVAGERNQRYLQGLVSRIPLLNRPLTVVTGVQFP